MRDIIKVTAAILEKNGQIIIAQRKSGDHLSGLWEFPGGKIEPGESPEACLARELNEEFNIEVTIGDFLGSNVHHYDHISIELMAYRASWVSGTISMNDHKAYRWVTVDQLTEYEFTSADVPFVDMLLRRLD
ncbi:(deoxy)nucleoside triphosphate pyrophosphohydrolase [Desulfosarcina ovata]|uniref:8-oxo-dGTP diphosphatase n=1 Tax=Desulfosarcina ovata subsp. ovata TaxID=2752305 RepID=A0A5K8AKI5_9BACT|nr:(deoxy)nucleoside triphosphate pyrophosphohydrolase [Desulfosarcina ovata]BBO93235.1 NUDIX hydrolase [Desulfosarcina ovata subsp. ovata]